MHTLIHTHTHTHTHTCRKVTGETDLLVAEALLAGERFTLLLARSAFHTTHISCTSVTACFGGAHEFMYRIMCSLAS